MELIYCTSIAFSNKLANLTQVQAMSRQFQKKLGAGFTLGVNYKNIEDKNIDIFCFNTNKSYKLAWKYLEFIKKNKINYVYCREARLLFFIILFNKLFFRLKLKHAYEIHAAAENEVINKIVERVLAKAVNKLIFITKILRDNYLEKYNINKNKTLIAPDAVDLNIFDINISKQDAREKLNLPEDKKILVYTGKFKTMGMDKGINDILKSLKYLSEDVMFLAVGGAEADIDFYNKQAEKIGVKNRIKLIGHVSQSELAIYQKAADVLLMPFPYTKHYAYYMSPLKMFEYMAAKRPIIATDLPSVTEILNENNSILVKPDDPKNLAEGIKGVLDSRGLAERISLSALGDVENYTWEKRAERILEFIERNFAII